ncbi:hypothetical protein DWG18_03845 [Lysobacter sp. TY2-98]|uniref:hypothetical protein n=1 Tax=Lysobacter sp. TY2-98 TaxID=2290922 RepID=UPI000E209BFF|nr:hypothetical protein [Lysobacter sp. TY2-98]AXK71510.1 hypothetical protein DWG18_03845 [Lysobacter sp. TY2-98]
MAALTLGFTGMDASTESELRTAFERALPASGGGWQLVPDTHADYVVVDMDSMYGPMSWLRLHNAGKQVVGLTASPRTQAPYRLGRPVDADALTELLRDIRVANGVEAVAAPAAAPPAAPAPAPAAPAAVAEPVIAKPSGMTPSPQPTDQLPEERPAPITATELPANPAAITEPAAPVNEPPSVAVGQVVPPAPSIQPVAPPPAAAPTPAPTPAATPARSAEPQSLAEWLASGRLRGRVRFADNGTAVLLDTDQRQYFGPSGLKPVTPLFSRNATVADFEAVSADVWNAQTAALGAPQPIARLIWYGALLAGEGRIAPGYDPNDRFRLIKWPQTEREFPKHFRIATAMMKGPATVKEVAEASSVPETDVADFVNASLASGFAEPYSEPEPEPDAAKSGLFGRLRGR